MRHDHFCTQKVRVMRPKGGGGKEGRSHTGLENERDTCFYKGKYIFKFYLSLININMTNFPQVIMAVYSLSNKIPPYSMASKILK